MLRYILFVVGAICGVFAAYWLGNQTLAELMARCDGLIYYGIGFALIASILIFPILLVRESFGFEESGPGWLISFSASIIYYSVVSVVAMWVLSFVPFVSSVTCVNCEIPASVTARIDANETNRTVVASELERIRDFNTKQRANLDNASDDLTKNIAEYNSQKECVLNGETQEIRALYLMAGFTLDDLNAIDPVDDVARADCTKTEALVNELLDDMQKVVDELPVDQQKDWEDKIADRRARVELLAKKCEQEMQMKQLSAYINEDNRIIDVQVQYTDSNDTPVEGISGLLRVVADNKNVEGISVTENRADDKACLMLVIDSSGSIPAEDLPNIVSAVQALNDVRKRGDLYGIVTFGGADEIQNYGLQQDIIDTGVINRNGGSTAIWDAMQVGLGEMVQNCDTNITKRYLVLVTDGKDNSSKFGKGEEKSAIVASLHSQAVLDQTSVCVIGVSKDVEEESANLEQLVNDCDYSYIDNFKNLAEQFKQIMGYERAYYRIVIPQSALPNNADDVRVRITDTNVKIKVTFSPAP
jgi:hypothetical protein